MSYYRWKYLTNRKMTISLREKCPNTEFFLVRIKENTDQEKLRIWTLFMQSIALRKLMKLFLITTCGQEMMISAKERPSTKKHFLTKILQKNIRQILDIFTCQINYLSRIYSFIGVHVFILKNLWYYWMS